MREADVVLYDRLADAGVMKLIPERVERIYVGKRPNDHELPQEEICALMIRLAREGKRVLRLKGGDPFMFGRGGEEIEALAAEACLSMFVRASRPRAGAPPTPAFRSPIAITRRPACS